MSKNSPPWDGPAVICAVDGGSKSRRVGKPGEIRRRKVTGLGRKPDSQPGYVMFAGLQLAKPGKPGDAKVGPALRKTAEW